MVATGVSFSVMKSAYISLIIGPRGLQCEIDLWENMAWESLLVISLQVKAYKPEKSSLSLPYCIVH